MILYTCKWHNLNFEKKSVLSQNKMATKYWWGCPSCGNRDIAWEMGGGEL